MKKTVKAIQRALLLDLDFDFLFCFDIDLGFHVRLQFNYRCSERLVDDDLLPENFKSDGHRIACS